MRRLLFAATLVLAIEGWNAPAFAQIDDRYSHVLRPIAETAPAAKKVVVPVKETGAHIIASRGLAGRVYSTGMDELVAKGHARGITGTVYDWPFESWMVAEAIAKINAGKKVILVGHSLGANAQVDVATRLGHLGYTVPLVVTYDPTPLVSCVPANVRFAYNFNQKLGAIGRGAIKPCNAAHKGRLINEQVNMAHVVLDNSDRLHQQTFRLIARAKR